MDLVQLKYFVAEAEAGHLTNAAKKLNVAQPALSVSIARLEKEVGVPLFDRVGRNISLNKFGEIYLEYAEQAFDRMRKAQQAVNKYAEKLEDILSLGIISKPLAWDLLLEFKERYPNSQIRQTELSPEHMEEELQKGTVDYVISSRLTMAPGLVCEVFREDPLALAVPADHPLASRKWIRLKEAEGEHFACLPKGYEYRTIVEEMCQDAGFTPNVVVECFHCHMAGVVGSGKAVTLMAENRVLENSYEERIRLVPIKDPVYTRNQYIIWRAGHHFNKIAREFRSYLRTYHQDPGGSECDGCG